MPLWLLFAGFAMSCSLKPKEDLSLCLQGYEASENGRHVVALSLYEACIRTGNLERLSLIRTYRNIGIAYRRNGNPALGVTYANQALALSPPDPWSDYVNRGNAWDEEGDVERAMADYALALKVKPNFGEAYYNRGISLGRQNKRHEAYLEFKKAYDSGLRTALLDDRLHVYEALEKQASK
jgi:tetratricopeptide (TPR) repeat protein